MGYAIQDLLIEKIDKLFDGLLKKHNNLNRHDFRKILITFKSDLKFIKIQRKKFKIY